MSNANRISVNVDNLNHWRSYAPPPNYWEEYTINCRECGAQMTVTAEDQRFYYEVEKRPEYWRPGCQPCRDRRDGVRESRRILAEALRNAKRTSDPIIIRAAIVAIMKYGKLADGGARNRLAELLERLPNSEDDEIVVRARTLVRSSLR